MSLRAVSSVVLILATLSWTLCCSGPSPDANRDVPVRVERVAVDSHDLPVLVLEEEQGPRWLPIWIGTAEARSIALNIEERSSPRPNSHDLIRNVIDGLEGEVTRVVVTDLRGGTYYAVLTLRARAGEVEIDSRPSDAIAIALRAGAPIFVRAELFESSGSKDAVETTTEGSPGRAI
jgi:bifunctional DNase/RNase